MDLELAGKNVVVTGGSKGIGRAIALAFAAEGANVATCARTEPPLDEVGEELRAADVSVYTQTCDVSDAGALAGFLDASREHLGGVDILVNNVSALAVTDDLAAWQANINVDLLGTVRAIQQVTPWMAENGGGSILNLSSISGLEATPSTDFGYAAVKAALISYTQKLAASLAPRRIRVNTIAPGSIEFEGGGWAQTKAQDPDFYNMVLSTIPWGRMGTPEEVGDVAVFVASPRASWITGACIVVDGGQHRGNR